MSVNALIEAHYMNSKARYHDFDWYVGEPCLAKFWYDGKWYRGIVTRISEVSITFSVICILQCAKVKCQYARKAINRQHGNYSFVYKSCTEIFLT